MLSTRLIKMVYKNIPFTTIDLLFHSLAVTSWLRRCHLVHHCSWTRVLEEHAVCVSKGFVFFSLKAKAIKASWKSHLDGGNTINRKTGLIDLKLFWIGYTLLRPVTISSIFDCGACTFYILIRLGVGTGILEFAYTFLSLIL